MISRCGRDLDIAVLFMSFCTASFAAIDSASRLESATVSCFFNSPIMGLLPRNTSTSVVHLIDGIFPAQSESEYTWMVLSGSPKNIPYSNVLCTYRPYDFSADM